jgi:hypothetical protein
MSFINLNLKNLKFEMPQEEARVVYDALQDEDLIQTRATLLGKIILLLFSNQIGDEEYEISSDTE